MMRIFIILALILSFGNTSFALSPERERIEYNVCYDGMLANGYTKARSKEYCICSVTMISNKYTDAKLDKIVYKGWDYMMKKIKFASDHCNKNRYAK